MSSGHDSTAIDVRLPIHTLSLGDPLWKIVALSPEALGQTKEETVELFFINSRLVLV